MKLDIYKFQRELNALSPLSFSLPFPHSLSLSHSLSLFPFHSISFNTKFQFRIRPGESEKERNTSLQKLDKDKHSCHLSRRCTSNGSDMLTIERKAFSLFDISQTPQLEYTNVSILFTLLSLLFSFAPFILKTHPIILGSVFNRLF